MSEEKNTKYPLEQKIILECTCVLSAITAYTLNYALFLTQKFMLRILFYWTYNSPEQFNKKLGILKNLK